MKHPLRMRLVGGPFEGKTLEGTYTAREPRDPPGRWYIVKCDVHGLHWWPEPTAGADVYRLDGEQDGWTIYVFTDEGLTDRARRQSAMSPAGIGVSS